MTTIVTAPPTPMPPRDQIEQSLRDLLEREHALRHRPRFARPRQWLRTARSLRCLGGVSTGNHVEVCCDGDLLLESLWRDIDRATKSVLIETYCLGSDPVGRRTVESLVQARARGCEVLVLYDTVGSMPVEAGLTARLQEAGGRVIAFHPLRFGALSKFLTRDHRKIAIIDHTIAYCGGMNISEEYAGPRYGTARFHDCHLRLEGPCIDDLAMILLDSLHEATGEDRAEHPALTVPAMIEGGVLVQTLGSNARRNVRSIQRALRCAIRRAGDRCWITTPYFVPPLRLRRAMSHAARRGVDVRLLTAGESDVPIARLAGRYVYDRLLRDGVHIYEMFGRTLHTKRATVDGILGTVGSFNLDTWSDRRNLEVAVTVLDTTLVEELEQHFLVDLKQSREVTLDGLARQRWHHRALQWGAYQLLRW